VLAYAAMIFLSKYIRISHICWDVISGDIHRSMGMVHCKPQLIRKNNARFRVWNKRQHL